MVSVSVIIPVYNVEKYLQRCLDSVFNQTFSDLEIICVNDGSPDNSLEILQENAKKDKRIKVISQSNQGLSQARNNGMLHASGKYLCFLDSDDFLSDNFVECLYKKAEEENADVVMTNVRYVSPKKTKQTNFSDAVFTKFYDKLNVFSSSACSNRLYRYDFAMKHKLSFPSGIYYEDILFVLQACYYSNKLATVSGGYYNYIANPCSITNDPKKLEKRKKDSLTSIKLVMDFVNNHQLASDEKDIVIKMCIENVVNSYQLSDKSYFDAVVSLLGYPKPLKNIYHKVRLKYVKRKIRNFFAKLLGIKTKKSA